MDGVDTVDHDLSGLDVDRDLGDLDPVRHHAHPGGIRSPRTLTEDLPVLEQAGDLLERPRAAVGADHLAPGEREDALLDIEALALRCRFTDCRHETEPGCAVVAAVEGGTLDASRFTSYRKLQRELRAIEVKADVRLQIEERRKWKLIHRSVKAHSQIKRRLG